MNYIGKIILYGFLLWMMVFIVSFVIYPLKETNPPFFETLITLFLTGFTVFFGDFYFKKGRLTLKNCLISGFSWVLICILIDLPLFSYGPMQMSFWHYMTDIGLTYLVIPVILSVYSFRRRGG